MTEKYLQAMLDGLTQKKEILDELTDLSEKQQKLVSAENIDWDEFDRIVDAKSELIDKLNAADDGFTAVYDRIKDEVKANEARYKDYIAKLQSGITEVTEKSTSLMALEERTKARVSSSFAKERAKISKGKRTNQAASTYYQNMSRINYIDPQLMDKKK